MEIKDSTSKWKVGVAGDVLLVGLDGFTIQDLAKLYPDCRIALHVKDGDKWVPVKLEDISK